MVERSNASGRSVGLQPPVLTLIRTWQSTDGMLEWRVKENEKAQY